MHTANKNLLFAVIIVIAIFLGVTFLIEKRKTTDQPVESVATSTESVADNYEVNEADLEKIQTVRGIDSTDHVFGSTTAPVKVIVYSDFACSFCAEFEDTLKQVRKDFGDQVTIAFRHFPLSDLQIESMTAANASECAAEQGKFWEMHDLLFEQNKTGKLSLDQIKENAIDLGLKKEQFNQCLDSQKYNEKIVAEQQEAKSFNVNGTPTTFVNGEMVIGANPYEDVTPENGQKIEGLKNIIGRHLNDK